MADISSPADAASPTDFIDNRLLATFPAALRDQLLQSARLISLDDGDVVIEHGEDVSRSLFPLGRCAISLSAQLEGGRSIEVTSIGSEGAIGGIVSCGHSPAFARGLVLMPGKALAVPMEVIEQVKASSGHLRNLFCRYADYLLAQIMQSSACNAFHGIEQRTARWLLTAQDRAGDRLELTQEMLARLLGVQRTTINAVIGQLQDEKQVTVRRGAIEITDRAGLLRRACSCYDSIQKHFGDIIGASGSGGSEGCD